jgi:hypothetical protein
MRKETFRTQMGQGDLVHRGLKFDQKEETGRAQICTYAGTIRLDEWGLK